MSQDDVQFKLRLDVALKEQLETAAHERGRTLTAEIVARLAASFSAADSRTHDAFQRGMKSAFDHVNDRLLDRTLRAEGEILLHEGRHVETQNLAQELLGELTKAIDLATDFASGDVRDPSLAAFDLDALIDRRSELEDKLDGLEPDSADS